MRGALKGESGLKIQHVLLGTLRDQIERYSCSGGVWTQTTDVEGEVNGLMT